MRVIDPGHTYGLNRLDGSGEEILNYVKREGEMYPGNVGYHPGTNMQEVIRSLIDRTYYLHNQKPHEANIAVLGYFRSALIALESRAAERHGRELHHMPASPFPEMLSTCPKCGHVECTDHCQRCGCKFKDDICQNYGCEGTYKTS